jgi:hypothetical protein
MKKGLLAFILFFAVNANAGLLLEPYLGYNFTAITDDNDNGTAASGAMLGARIGWTVVGAFFVAFDYSTGEMEWEPEGAVALTLDGTLTRMGVTVGADIPVAPIRLWLGYYQSEYDPSGGGFNYEFEDGTGLKLGVGLTFLPIVDINLEYFNGKYDDFKINGITINQEMEDKGLMLSISAPFDI